MAGRHCCSESADVAVLAWIGESDQLRAPSPSSHSVSHAGRLVLFCACVVDVIVSPGFLLAPPARSPRMKVTRTTGPVARRTSTAPGRVPPARRKMGAVAAAVASIAIATSSNTLGGSWI